MNINVCRAVCVLLILFVFLQHGDAKKKSDASNSNAQTPKRRRSASEQMTPDCPGMFQCKNSTCIDKNKICNAETDCLENEDEDNCIQPANMADACSSHTDCDNGGCKYAWYCEEQHCSCHMYSTSGK